MNYVLVLIVVVLAVLITVAGYMVINRSMDTVMIIMKYRLKGYKIIKVRKRAKKKVVKAKTVKTKTRVDASGEEVFP